MSSIVFKLAAIILAICLKTQFSKAASANSSLEEKLIKFLIKGSNPSVSPFRSESEGVVGIFYFPLHIKKYDYSSNTLSLSAVIMMVWEDVRLNWATNTTFAEIEDTRLPQDAVWHPRVKLHGMTRREYLPKEQPMLMVDSLGMASRDLLFQAHFPCEKSGSANNEYRCEMYLTVEDPNFVTKLNVGFGDHDGIPNEESKSASIDFYHFCENSLYEVIDSGMELLEYYPESLPAIGPSLRDPSKAFRVSLSIRVRQDARKTGFYVVAVFGLLIGVAQLALSGNHDVISRFFLAIGSLFSFVAIMVAAQWVRNDFKLTITRMSIGQLLMMSILVTYNVILLALGLRRAAVQKGLASEGGTLPSFMRHPQLKFILDGKSLTDLSDWLIILVIFLVFIITISC